MLTFLLLCGYVVYFLLPNENMELFVCELTGMQDCQIHSRHKREDVEKSFNLVQWYSSSKSTIQKLQ